MIYQFLIKIIVIIKLLNWVIIIENLLKNLKNCQKVQIFLKIMLKKSEQAF